MAFLWCEFFDKIGSDANLLLKYPLSGSGHTFISGRLGGQAMRLSNFWSCPIPSSSTIIVGFALNWLSDNLTYRRDLLKFFEDSTLHIEVEYAGSGMGWSATGARGEARTGRPPRFSNRFAAGSGGVSLTRLSPAQSIPGTPCAPTPVGSLPRRLLYAISARVGGTGLDNVAHQTLIGADRAGFLARAVAFTRAAKDAA